MVNDVENIIGCLAPKPIVNKVSAGLLEIDQLDNQPYHRKNNRGSHREQYESENLLEEVSQLAFPVYGLMMSGLTHIHTSFNICRSLIIP
jgi:hypothetical protein